MGYFCSIAIDLLATASRKDTQLDFPSLLLLTSLVIVGCSKAKLPQNTNNFSAVKRDTSYTANCKPRVVVSSGINPWE